ncbi:hypothetical protein ACQJBY_050015 [Aegilops geniculata]
MARPFLFMRNFPSRSLFPPRLAARVAAAAAAPPPLLFPYSPVAATSVLPPCLFPQPPLPRSGGLLRRSNFVAGLAESSFLSVVKERCGKAMACRHRDGLAGWCRVAPVRRGRRRRAAGAGSAPGSSMVGGAVDAGGAIN